jgi:hypothetical protein
MSTVPGSRYGRGHVSRQGGLRMLSEALTALAMSGGTAVVTAAGTEA